MKTHFDGYNWILRLDRGEKLIESLDKFAKEKDVKGGFLTGIGGASSAELGFYNLGTKEYSWQKINEPLEVTALQGNLAIKDGEPIWHIHGTFSDEKMQAIGGHVKELEVSGTLELFLHVIIDGGLKRSHSDDIGLDLLNL